MCDYCGCRANPEIAALSADHERILEVLQRLKRTVRDADAVAAAAQLAELAALVGPHADREEQTVFRGLRVAGFDEAYVAAFERDHERIHALLDAGGEEWEVTADELVRVLEEHIFKEESDAFPAAAMLVVPSVWDALVSRCGAEMEESGTPAT